MLRCLPLLLLLPAVAFAQTPEVVAKVDAKLDAERAAQRNEDIEILRRLLNKAAGLPDKAEVMVASPESLIQQGTPKASAGNRIVSPVGPFDGVYLPGGGVVFTLHIPAGVPTTTHGDRIGLNSSCNTCHQPQVHVATGVPVSLATCATCHSEVPKVEAQLSDWDRVRQDVRGDKSKPADKPKADKPKAAVCEPGDLQTLIAGVLAANAQHVRHLGEKEGITVVVTFDEAAAGRQTYPGADSEAFVPRNPSDIVWLRESLPTLTEKPGFAPDEVKALSLGDLHLKQGKSKEACDAYASALARFKDKEFKLRGPANLTAEQRTQYDEEFQKGVRDAMKNYAKALLLADQPEKAKEALDMAVGFVVLEVTPTTVPAKSTAPAKLILTVRKTDIDAAKDAAAFKKAVKAERVNFPK